MSDVKHPKGGGFLLDKACGRAVFVPEELPEDVLALGQAAFEFVENEVIPRINDFEDSGKKVATNIEMLRKAGDQGLLSLEIPEEYGGLGLGITAAMYLAEKVAQYASFTVSMLCHVGIGTLPILYFGNQEQKKRYLPKLGSGERLAAYALTEANYGSDALGAKTKAIPVDGGKQYLLTGEKVFITNGGFADVFTVYAKVNGEQFTAFLVEREMPGVSIGPEEHKLGIKGSSTTSVILDEVKVPAENILGKIGEGHKSALGVLDIGRFKLGVGTMGGAKRTLGVAAKYANERKQFQKQISSFGMIRRKLADMAARIYAVESMGYRTAGMIEAVVNELDHSAEDFASKAAHVFEEYDIECSIIKVAGSEAASAVIDDAVQIHGGYGFIEEYEVARGYRDERINRIFEGTNEVNRLLMPATMLKRSMTGRLPVMPEYMKLFNLVKGGEGKVVESYEGMPLAPLARMTESARRLTLYAFGSAMRKFTPKLTSADFIMGEGEYYFEKLANMVMAVFAMESSVLRAQKLLALNGEQKAANAVNLTHLVCADSMSRVLAEIDVIASSLAEGKEEEVARHKAAIDRLTYVAPMSVIALQDKVASKVVEFEKYVV